MTTFFICITSRNSIRVSETRPHPAAETLSTGIQRRKALLLATVFPVRYPVSGKVVYSCYHPGKFLVAWHEKSSVTNEHNTVVIRTADGTDVLVRQIAGAVARRIVSYAEPEAEVKALDELGFIKFGSRVDVFFPVGTRVCVREGQKVRGGLDVLAEISI